MLKMNAHPTQAHLIRYVSAQISNFFPVPESPFQLQVDETQAALQRTLHCLSAVKGVEPDSFDPLVSWQYTIFLYYLSNEVGTVSKRPSDAALLFYLNKALNGIDLYYEVQMPDVFLIGHTVSMVFAKATYGPRCVFHQGCTVGRIDDKRPLLEEDVVLYPNASVIGHCHIRANTVVAPGVQLVNIDSPGNCLVLPGTAGKPIFKELNSRHTDRFFKTAG